MRGLLLLVITIALAFSVKGQGSIHEFFAEDIQVIFKEVPRDVVSVIVVIKGGTANYTKETEGIEALAIKWAVEGGTVNYPKDVLNQKIESSGAIIDFYTGYDYSLIEMTCLKRHWAEAWSILSDILINPALQTDQFKLAKTQLISDAKYNNQDPNTKLRYLAMANAFAGKNYEKIPEGTARSLERLTADQVKNYYENFINKKNCFISIVGDLQGDSLRISIFERLKDLPSGGETRFVQDEGITSGPPQMHYRKLETNYIRGYMNAPRLESEEGLAILIGMEMLDKRIFDIVRVKAGLSYNPTAYFANAIIHNPYNVLYISTSQPREAIKLMVEVLQDVKENGFTSEELAAQKATYLTSYYLDQETTSSQCNAIVMNELRGGWRKAIITPGNLSKLDHTTVNEVIKKYTNLIRWTYLGNKNTMSESDFVNLKK